MAGTVVRGVAGFVAGFLVLAFAGAAAYNFVGAGMLDAAGWAPGLDPPTGYVWFTLTVQFLAAVLAGAVIALIAKTAAPVVVGALIVISGGRGIIEFAGTQGSNPHWYTLGLALVLLPALPLGVVVAKRLRGDLPLQRDPQ